MVRSSLAVIGVKPSAERTCTLDHGDLSARGAGFRDACLDDSRDQRGVDLADLVSDDLDLLRDRQLALERELEAVLACSKPGLSDGVFGFAAAGELHDLAVELHRGGGCLLRSCTLPTPIGRGGSTGGGVVGTGSVYQ